MKHIRTIKGQLASKLTCIGFDNVKPETELDGTDEMHLVSFEAPVGFCQIRFWERQGEVGGASVMVWPTNRPKDGKRYYYLGHWSAPKDLDWKSVGTLLWRSFVDMELENRDRGLISWIPDHFLNFEEEKKGPEEVGPSSSNSADTTSLGGLSTEISVDEGSVLGMFGG